MTGCVDNAAVHPLEIGQEVQQMLAADEASRVARPILYS